MTLDLYLADTGTKETAFADLIGVDQSTVNRIRKGQIPSPRVMAKIAEVTSGAVSPNDFFGIADDLSRPTTSDIAA